ncbi:MAG TPA: methyl-accepting chemotaxis protein [Gammaproteobacteria bacterium]|nr:methyl-accepting chemotaxis protein [Gammaproteobacteria bacterium]
MKGPEDLQQARGLRRAATVLTVLVVVAILLMGASFAYVWYHSGFDREYIRRSETVRVLSQTIAKNASEAANGKTDAFALLRESSDKLQANLDALMNGNPDTGLPPTKEASEKAADALQKVERPWKSIKKEVNQILERRDLVIATNEVAEKFKTSVPRLQGMGDSLIKRLKAVNASGQQIYYATRLQLYAERIARNISEMLRGGLGNRTATARLQSASDQFSRTLAGLRDGSSDLSVAAVTDSKALSVLSDITSLYSSMQDQLDKVLQQSLQLFQVRDAADGIFITSDNLLASTDYLSGIYRGLTSQRPIKEWYGFVAGGIALLLLILRGFVTRRINQADIAAKEAERAAADEQQQRNQQAILNLLDEIEGLREGDLTVQASVGEEITGAIGDAFNDAIDALRSLATTINETSVQVSSAAQQSQATAMHLTEASDHQAHQITAASAAVNEMAVSIDQVSRNAEESARVAQQSVDLSLRGAETVMATIEQMDTIREQIQETSKRMKRLGESSQEIGNIVELINDIADQTNILALNASIQAAMAGESGRGFAVVADEVQRLAERSGNATKQIEALVKTIQTDTNEAVISMEQSTAGVVSGARQAEAAGEALREIETVSKQLAGLIQNISEASRQQANAASNVSDTMNVIQEITSQTSAGTNETATSIGNLADLANELRSSVAGFKLPE